MNAPAPSSDETRTRRFWRDTGYALTAFPLSLGAFVVGVVGFCLGVATLVIWIGVPILVGTVIMCRGLAQFERLQLKRVQFRGPGPIAYQSAPPGASRLKRILAPLRDPQSWLDLVWSVTGLVTGLLAFCVLVVWWAVVGAGLSYWFWQQWLPAPDESLASLIGWGSGRGPDIALNTIFGLVALLTLPVATRTVAWLHGSFSSALLNSRSDLAEELRRAVGARTAAQDAEVTALRRLERDIHDGPQQRLVRLSMDLGRARRQLTQDPALAEQILDESLDQARETVAELRALSRGIAPPLLVDRGLPAALAELAARHTGVVELEVSLTQALSPAIETAVYFTVSEALTNVAKHSGAARVTVRVVRTGEQVAVSVIDDGVGGAHLAKGQGLAGLQQRLAGVAGDLDVLSPPGGPTEIQARIPLPTVDR